MKSLGAGGNSAKLAISKFGVSKAFNNLPPKNLCREDLLPEYKASS